MKQIKSFQISGSELSTSFLTIYHYVQYMGVHVGELCSPKPENYYVDHCLSAQTASGRHEWRPNPNPKKFEHLDYIDDKGDMEYRKIQNLESLGISPEKLRLREIFTCHLNSRGNFSPETWDTEFSLWYMCDMVGSAI